MNDADPQPLSETGERRYMAGGWEHWNGLAAGLPTEGVLKRFATDELCRARLSEVRWPGGPTCLRCTSTDVTLLATRPVYLCRSCRYQFSVTVGTVLHRSRVSLVDWFSAAEDVIRYQARYDDVVPSNMLADRIGVSYAAAWRLRARILRDLAPEGPGILRRAVCSEPDPQG